MAGNTMVTEPETPGKYAIESEDNDSDGMTKHVENMRGLELAKQVARNKMRKKIKQLQTMEKAAATAGPQNNQR